MGSSSSTNIKVVKEEQKENSLYDISFDNNINKNKLKHNNNIINLINKNKNNIHKETITPTPQGNNTNNNTNTNDSEFNIIRIEKVNKKKSLNQIESEEKAKDNNETQKENEEKEIFKNNKKIYVYLLIKNLEAKDKYIEDLRECIDIIFNNNFDALNNAIDNELETKVIKKSIITQLSNAFNNYLDLEFYDDKNIVEKLLEILNEEYNDTNEFKDYLNQILNNVSDYKNLGDNEDKISNYIINSLNDKQTLYNDLLKKYKSNYIIKFNDFAKIIKDNQISLIETANEYLLYKMKINNLNNIKMKFDEFNLKIFLEFFNEKK